MRENTSLPKCLLNDHPSRTDTCDILQKKGKQMQQWQKQRKQQQHQQQEQEQKKRRKYGTSDDGRRNSKYKKKSQRLRAEQDENVERRHGSVPNKERWYSKQHAHAVQHEPTTFPRPILLLLAIFLKLYIADISG